jgi:hypothetical protein
MFGLFGNKNEKKLSFAFGGYKFISDGKYIKYQSIYGKSFRVLISDIKTVSLQEAGRGKNTVRLVGEGTTLAEVELPQSWAENAQDFILEQKRSENELK